MTWRTDRQSGTVAVKIDNAFEAAFAATFGVLIALAIFLVVAEALAHDHVDSTKVRALCAHHRGVERVDDGTTFMEGTFVTCRDGWYERADN